MQTQKSYCESWAIAKPQYDHKAKTWWDGKLGMWPVGEFTPALRNSKNRKKGTMVWISKTMNRALY